MPRHFVYARLLPPPPLGARRTLNASSTQIGRLAIVTLTGRGRTLSHRGRRPEPALGLMIVQQSSVPGGAARSDRGQRCARRSGLP